MSFHLKGVGEASSGGERQLFPEGEGGGLNRNGSGESQTLTQSN